MNFKKEEPCMRDIIAMNVAGALILKSAIPFYVDDCCRGVLGTQSGKALDSVAFLAYNLADRMIKERVEDRSEAKVD